MLKFTPSKSLPKQKLSPSFSPSVNSKATILPTLDMSKLSVGIYSYLHMLYVCISSSSSTSILSSNLTPVTSLYLKFS